MLAEIIRKVKHLIKENADDLFIALIIFLVGIVSFGLGRLSIIWPQKEPITIENHESRIMNQEGIALHGLKNSDSRGKYVASKNGTAYHLPWCQGAQKIKEENRIWFDTKEEAERSGYKPAGNCEGL